MKTYEVRYTKRGSVMIYLYTCQAKSESTAISLCRSDRDVESVASVIAKD